MSLSKLDTRVSELERLVRNLRTEMNLIRQATPRPAILDFSRNHKESVDFAVTAGRQTEKRYAKT